MRHLKIVDELGKLRARRANLERAESRLSSRLKALGTGAYEGYLFRATVSDCETVFLDARKASKKLPPRLLKAIQSRTEYVRVNVVSRNGRGL